MSAYRDAIDHTTQTIGNRAKQYRNLIVAVTFVGLGSILWAGIVWSWLPLTGIFLLVPLCGLYLFVDETLLNQWRHGLFIAWVNGEIDFYALDEAVLPIATLPKDTVRSMLETLPSAGDLAAEQGILASTRMAIATVVNMIHACRSDQIAFKAAVYTVAGSAGGVAAAFWMWQPLLGAFGIGLVLLLRKGLKKRRLKNAGERIVAAQQEPDFNLENFLKIVGQIHWTPISDSEKRTILANLSGGFVKSPRSRLANPEE